MSNQPHGSPRHSAPRDDDGVFPVVASEARQPRIHNEYHVRLAAFLADLVPHLRERGQHELADRAEHLQQDLPQHDAAAETVWQHRRKLLEFIDLTEL